MTKYELLPYTKASPAYIVTQTPNGPRVLARFFENSRRDTANVLVPDGFSTRFDGVLHKVVEEHYSVHALTRSARPGRLITRTSVFQPKRKESHASLVECDPKRFVWAIASHRYALEGLGDLPNRYRGPLFRLPDYNPMRYHLIGSIIASDVRRPLPDVRGWGRIDVVGVVFRMGFYFTFMIGPANESSGAIFHPTSSPKINGKSVGHYAQPAKPLRLAQIGQIINQDRALFVEREIERMREHYRVDTEFMNSLKTIDEAITDLRQALDLLFFDPAELEKIGNIGELFDKFEEI